MEFTTIIKKLNNINNGTWFKMVYTTEVPVSAAAKASGHSVVKVTNTTVRKGLEYSNLSRVKEQDMANPDNQHILKWGHWMEGYYKLFIEHEKAGSLNRYLRIYTSPNKPESTYFLDGKMISAEKLKLSGIVLNSYWTKKASPTDTMTVNIQNIISIG